MSALDIEKEREQFAEWHLKEFGYWPRETDLYGHVFNVWLAAKRATQPAPSVPAQAGTAYSAGELELARLAAEHFGRPARDIPALAAFERHRAEQVKVPGMPGLSGAIPNFIAGYRAKAAETKSAGTVSGGDGPLPPLPRPRCTYADHSYPAFNRSQMLDYARAAIAAAGQGGEDAKVLYNELLFAVATKHPGESRHQTALRYIRRAEEAKCSTATTAKESNHG